MRRQPTLTYSQRVSLRAREESSVSRTGDADPSFRRTIGIVTILIAVTYLTFSRVYGQSAPMGNWKNQIFGQSAWSEWGPGGRNSQ